MTQTIGGVSLVCTVASSSLRERDLSISSVPLDFARASAPLGARSTLSFYSCRNALSAAAHLREAALGSIQRITLAAASAQRRSHYRSTVLNWRQQRTVGCGLLRQGRGTSLRIVTGAVSGSFRRSAWGESTAAGHSLFAESTPLRLDSFSTQCSPLAALHAPWSSQKWPFLEGCIPTLVFMRKCLRQAHHRLRSVLTW